MDELGAQLDRRVRAGALHGVNAATGPVARFDDHHAPARGRQPLRRAEAGDPRADHQGVGRAHRRPPATRTGAR